MSLAERRAEFERYLWNHSEDAFQAGFDARPPLDSDDLKALRMLAKAAQSQQPDDLAKVLREQIRRRGSEHFFLILQLCGLTRSKIISDLKALPGHGGKRVKLPSTHMGIVESASAWNAAGPYLALRVMRVLSHLTDGPESNGAFEALNQATWPGYVRQERAKRQGHEAEGRLARVLHGVGLPFEPKEKATNPLVRDVQIHGVSFDLVMPSEADPKVVVKSTVHTSNIGQFGESKDDLEVREARTVLRAEFAAAKRPTLLALIDGVGFKSNTAGLNGVLEEADEFCQFRTLWKAGVIVAKAVGVPLTVYLTQEDSVFQRSFLAKWDYADLTIRALTPRSEPSSATQAGDGYIKRS